jgi:hypothetical protein
MSFAHAFGSWLHAIVHVSKQRCSDLSERVLRVLLSERDGAQRAQAAPWAPALEYRVKDQRRTVKLMLPTFPLLSKARSETVCSPEGPNGRSMV